MLKRKLLYFGYLIWTASLLEKSLMLGKIKGRRRGHQRICLDGIIDAMDMNLGKCQKTMRNRETWCATVYEVTKCRTWLESIQTSSVTQWYLILCDAMDCSILGLPVHNQLLEFTQPHVHRVGDAVQPSHPHPLSSPSPPTFNLSQHQGLFKWVISSYQVAKILEFQIQHQSFQGILRTDFL